MSQNSHATFFVSGNEQKSFTYEPGDKAFYINVRSRSYQPHTLVIHANDEFHVQSILRDLIAFEKECIAEYEANMKDSRTYIAKIQRTSLLEELLDSNELKIEELNKGLVITLNPLETVKSSIII